MAYGQIEWEKHKLSRNHIITTYEQALRRYNATKPWRGRPDQNTRPLGQRAQGNLTLRRLPDDSIAFTLYRTDCVVYHPDGSITLEGTDHLMTRQFISVLTPEGLRPCGSTTLGPLVAHKDSEGACNWWDATPTSESNQWGPIYTYSRPKDQKLTSIAEPTRFYQTPQGGWYAPSPTTMLAWREPSPGVARALGKQYLLDFRAFCASLWTLDPESRPTHQYMPNRLDALLDMVLEGQLLEAYRLMPVTRKWVYVGPGMGSCYEDRLSKTTFDKLRVLLIEREGALTAHEAPTIAFTDLMRIERLRRTYG